MRESSRPSARGLLESGDIFSTSTMAYSTCTVPAGDKIIITHGKLNVPDHPIVPFIRGDGTGPDIWAASQRVFDAAVQKAYGGTGQGALFEVIAGETAFKKVSDWPTDENRPGF